jgi:hypothetical protein
MCGVAIDVPSRKAKFRFLVDPKEPLEYAASTATPGAAMSGLSRSPALPSEGPREEKSAICG